MEDQKEQAAAEYAKHAKGVHVKGDTYYALKLKKQTGISQAFRPWGASEYQPRYLSVCSDTAAIYCHEKYPEDGEVLEMKSSGDEEFRRRIQEVKHRKYNIADILKIEGPIADKVSTKPGKYGKECSINITFKEGSGGKKREFQTFVFVDRTDTDSSTLKRPYKKLDDEINLTKEARGQRSGHDLGMHAQYFVEQMCTINTGIVLTHNRVAAEVEEELAEQERLAEQDRRKKAEEIRQKQEAMSRRQARLAFEEEKRIEEQRVIEKANRDAEEARKEKVAAAEAKVAETARIKENQRRAKVTPYNVLKAYIEIDCNTEINRGQPSYRVPDATKVFKWAEAQNYTLIKKFTDVSAMIAERKQKYREETLNELRMLIDKTVTW